jgi:amino acid transporter
MSYLQTLSLPAAILININIMLGTGVFINTAILAQHTGILGSFLYVIAGLLMLPLVLCIADLTSKHKEGNFYNFGAILSPFWGFLSAWSYCIAKLASASLSIHVFATFLKHIIPALTLPTVVYDCMIIAFFVILNTLHVKTGSRIQYGFIVMKSIPLLSVLCIGLFKMQLIHVASPDFIWAGIPVGLPLVLFCFLGFESACSLSRHIKNSQRNAPITILFSFITVMLLVSAYQFLFYATVGSALAQQKQYVDAFPLLIRLFTVEYVQTITTLFSIAIATSALGGAYGILYSNMWNFYTLAEHNHLIFSNSIKQLNQHHIPFWCIIIEGFICCGYVLLGTGAQIPLQYIATLGCIATYTISLIAYFQQARSVLSIIGLSSCLVLLFVCLSGFISTSIVPLILFSAILLVGIGMYSLKKINFSS